MSVCEAGEVAGREGVLCLVFCQYFREGPFCNITRFLKGRVVQILRPRSQLLYSSLLKKWFLLVITVDNVVYKRFHHSLILPNYEIFKVDFN